MDEGKRVMEIDLGRVEARASFAFEGSFDLPTPEGGDAPCAARVKALVTRTGARYAIETQVAGDVRVECHRCLAPFAMPIETAFTVIVNRGERTALPENAEEEDFVSMPAAGETAFDLYPRVREALILEMPIKLLCREDCRGVCRKCGANLNEGECGCGPGTGDPRWGALKKFLNGENKT